jgi:hypothetical protein
MKIGDMIMLSSGPVYHFDLTNPVAVLVAKVPRQDYLEYGWLAFASGRFIRLGRQIEQTCEVLNAKG